MTTTDLVPVFAGTLAGQSAHLCNARDLHAALGVGSDFVTWIKQRIAEYRFAEGEDFSPVSGRIAGKRGQPRTDYHLTIDMAKELAMVENNDRGRQVRRYFIQIEKNARAKPPLGADTLSRIYRHAWSLAQSTFERYRREMTDDIENQRHHTAIEDWKPQEYRQEFFEQLAANAMICHTFAAGIDRNAANLAAMAGVDYASVSAKYHAGDKQ